MSSGLALSRLLAVHQPHLPSTSRLGTIARQQLYSKRHSYSRFRSTFCVQPTEAHGSRGTWIFWRGFRTRRGQGQVQPKEPQVNGNGSRSGPEFHHGVLKAAIVEERTAKDLIKPALFTVGFCGAAVVGSVVWQEERRVKTQQRLKEFFQRQGLGWRLPEGFQAPARKRGEMRQALNQYRQLVKETWESLSPGQQTIAVLIAANAVVYLAWKVPEFRPLMDRFFISSMHLKHNCQSMLWSVFSHKLFLHGAINMYVLNSFGSQVVDAKLGMEQFLGLYLASGVVSSFVGCSYKLLTAVRAYSVGASGAILGILGYTLCVFPDIRLSIIFLPWFTFTAQAALAGILCFDAAGLIFGFKLFDHAAHLGGTLFGVFYAMYGERFVNELRPRILKWWKEIKGRRPSDTF